MENSNVQKAIAKISNVFAIIAGTIIIGYAGYTFGKWVQSLL